MVLKLMNLKKNLTIYVKSFNLNACLNFVELWIFKPENLLQFCGFSYTIINLNEEKVVFLDLFLH